MVRASILCILFSALFFPLELHGASALLNHEGNSQTHANIPHVAYRLGPNDLIKVQVFGQPDLTLETRVSGDGKIRMPLLGVLEVTGLSVQETEDLVTKRLSHELLKNPRVTVNILKYRNVYVSGQVKNPGGYPYEDELTVLKVLALAGGLTDKAAKWSADRIHVKRQNGTNGKEAENKTMALDDLILPDDIVQVPDCQTIYVSGEVRSPGAYTYEEGMTVLKAIMMAGGFTNKASEGRVKIKRLTGGKLDSLSVKLEDRLSPDDAVVVPESFF